MEMKQFAELEVRSGSSGVSSS